MTTMVVMVSGLNGMGCLIEGAKVHKMSKKSFIGRVALLIIYAPVVVVEALLNKAEDWAFSVRAFRRKLDKFADEKFPLNCNKKTNI